MHFTFIFPNMYAPYPGFSPALQLLSSILKNHGHEVTLLHLHKTMIPDDEKIIINHLKQINPDIIGFTSTSFEYSRVNGIADAIKQEIEVPLILGGVHATVAPDDYAPSNFDAFIVGEGEQVILSIANGEIQPNGIIHGVSIDNLDDLPFYDWDVIDTKKIIDGKNGWLDIGFSRDCAFQCSFCANSLLRKIRHIHHIRKRDVTKCIDELKYLISRFNIKVINFSDDEFTPNRKWFFEFLREYKKEIYDKHGITYVIQSRVNTVNEKMVRTLKASGCIEAQFGVETGSQRLRDFLDKGVTNEQIINTFRLFNKYNINTYAYIMLGIPTETEANIWETINLLATIKPNIIRPTFLCPVKGTKIYDYCVKNDLIKKSVAVWNYESPLKLDHISEEQLIKYWFSLPWLVNLEMGFTEYKDGIDQLFNIDYDDLNNGHTFTDLLTKDYELSSMMTEKMAEHFSYKIEKNINPDRKITLGRIQLQKPDRQQLSRTPLSCLCTH